MYVRRDLGQVFSGISYDKGPLCPLEGKNSFVIEEGLNARRA